MDKIMDEIIDKIIDKIINYLLSLTVNTTIAHLNNNNIIVNNEDILPYIINSMKLKIEKITPKLYELMDNYEYEEAINLLDISMKEAGVEAANNFIKDFNNKNVSIN
jgi:hypothetical protein